MFVELLSRVYEAWLWVCFLVQKVDNVSYVFHAVDFEVVYYGSLALVLLRHYQPLKALLSCLYGYGQCSPYGLQCAVEAQFAHHHEALQVDVLYAFVGSQYAYGYRQVVAAALLAYVGRRQVDGYFRLRELVSVVVYSRRYSVAALPDSLVAKSRQVIVEAFRRVYLNGYSRNVESVDGSAVCFYKHCFPIVKFTAGSGSFLRVFPCSCPCCPCSVLSVCRRRA